MALVNECDPYFLICDMHEPMKTNKSRPASIWGENHTTQEIDILTPNHIMNHPAPYDVSSLKNNSVFLTFCWPCISVYLSHYLTILMHKICFTIRFILCLYMFRANVLIIRRSKLHCTASGRWPSRARDGHLYVWWYQRLCNAISTSWWWAHVLETCRGMK